MGWPPVADRARGDDDRALRPAGREIAQVDVLDGGQEGRGGVDQHRHLQMPLPVGRHGDEVLPLIGHPRRRQGLGGDDQHKLVGLVEAGLELADPGAPAAEVDLVEKDLPRLAGLAEAGLQVGVEGFNPV